MLVKDPSPRIVVTRLKWKAPIKPQFKPPTTNKMKAIMCKNFNFITPFRDSFVQLYYSIFEVKLLFNSTRWIYKKALQVQKCKGALW